MKRMAFVLLLVLFIISSISVVYAEMPKAEPDELWKYITEISPYKQWGFWPDHQGMQPGRAPHGRFHQVYVNDRILNSTKTPVQYGSIEVKENYSDQKELVAITVMYKVHGYNPDDGDWFWAKYSVDGKADPFGKPSGCIGCHGTRANNDFILVHEFK